MKKSRILHLITGGLITVSLVVSSFAIFAKQAQIAQNQPKLYMQNQKAGGSVFYKSLNYINLSTKQRAQVQQVLTAHRVDLLRLHRQMRLGFGQLKDLMLTKKRNNLEINQLAKTQGALVTQMILQENAIASEVLPLLTNEQIDHLKTIKMPMRHQKGMKMGDMSDGKMKTMQVQSMPQMPVKVPTATS